MTSSPSSSWGSGPRISCFLSSSRTDSSFFSLSNRLMNRLDKPMFFPIIKVKNELFTIASESVCKLFMFTHFPLHDRLEILGTFNDMWRQHEKEIYAIPTHLCASEEIAENRNFTQDREGCFAIALFGFEDRRLQRCFGPQRRQCF